MAMRPVTGRQQMFSKNNLEPLSLSSEFVPFSISSRIMSVDALSVGFPRCRKGAYKSVLAVEVGGVRH